MGFFAVLSSLGLLFLDAKFEKISSVPSRKRAVTTDMILSGLLTFLSHAMFNDFFLICIIFIYLNTILKAYFLDIVSLQSLMNSSKLL